MKRLFVVMAFLSCCFTGNAQLYVQENSQESSQESFQESFHKGFQESFHKGFRAFLLGENEEKAVVSLESVGLEKVTLKDYALVEVFTGKDEEYVEKINKVLEAGGEKLLEQGVKKLIEQGMSPYVFKGTCYGKDNGYFMFAKTENEKIHKIGVTWFRHDMSSLLQLYTELYTEMHNYLPDELKDLAIYKYKGDIKGLSPAQVLKYLERGNEVSISIIISIVNDPEHAAIYLNLEPQINLELKNNYVRLSISNPYIRLMD